MGREVRRVPLDFDQPLGKTWPGFLMPRSLHEDQCPDCKNGYSQHGQMLHDLWYGYLPFDPASTGSTPLTPESPAVRALAERHINDAPEFYGVGESAIAREAWRLADLWNGAWCHHLAQEDVDALVAAGRLRDLTHTWTKGAGLQPKDPPVRPTAAQVNEWSLCGFGHDSINAMIAVEARCEREGMPTRCATCDGHATIEAYPGQRAEAEAWEREDPPAGEGWQLWETVSEGSPISPVFADAEGLAQWLVHDAGRLGRVSSIEVARRFVGVGWAPTGFSSDATGYVQGPEFVGRTTGGA